MERDPSMADTVIEEPVPAGDVLEPPEGAEQKVSDLQTQQQLKAGASWFYWLAGLSIINSVIVLFNGQWSFLFGLGATQVVDAFVMAAIEEGSSGITTVVKVIGFGLNVLIAGVFVLFGVFAHRRHTWAFVVGMILYFLDALIFLLVQDFLGLAFHAFVLFSLFAGLRACLQLNRRDAPDFGALHPS